MKNKDLLKEAIDEIQKDLPSALSAEEKLKLTVGILKGLQKKYILRVNDNAIGSLTGQAYDAFEAGTMEGELTGMRDAYKDVVSDLQRVISKLDK